MTYTLIVVAPRPDLIDHLDDLDVPFELAMTPGETMQAAARHKRHILAYAEGCWGAACTGQPVRVATENLSILLAMGEATSRPASMLSHQACGALRAYAVIDAANPLGVAVLRSLIDTGDWADVADLVRRWPRAEVAS